MTQNPDWEARLAKLWASLDDLSEEEFLTQMNDLTTEVGDDSSVALFERACSFDSTGHSDRAVPLYRQALEHGLDGLRRRRAVIQLASSLRNIGQSTESVTLLTTEREFTPDLPDEEVIALDDAVDAFLALALADTGREREALTLALTALAHHLPRYQRSLASYAQELSTDALRDTAESELEFHTKVAVVLDQDLAVWQKTNVTAFLVSGLAATDPAFVGEPYVDASGNHYLPMCRQPIMIYAADRPGLRRAYERAAARGIERLAIFTHDLFSTPHDAANRAAVATVAAPELDLAGIALHAERKTVDKVLDKLRPHP